MDVSLIRYFLIPKSRDLVSHNPGNSGLKNGPGSRDSGSRSRDCNSHAPLSCSAASVPNFLEIRVRFVCKQKLTMFIVVSNNVVFE